MSMAKEIDLCEGRILPKIVFFSLPIILGNLFQQAYNLVDTLIVGRVLGPESLASVGSAYALMTFINSLLIGLSMGSGALFSYNWGKGEKAELRKDIYNSFILFSILAIILTTICYVFLNQILVLLRTPKELLIEEKEYLKIIFLGIFFVFLYNYVSYILRSKGDSKTPLYFLILSALINIALDLFFIIKLKRGVKGAGEATVIAEAFSALGIITFFFIRNKNLLPLKEERIIEVNRLKNILRYSFLTSIQQSVMNFGILMIQSLVNSFGSVTMAAFAASVKIDTLSYTPSQEFGNAYSIFISQNLGANKKDRVKKGTKEAFVLTSFVAIILSIVIYTFSSNLMELFVNKDEIEVIKIGVEYLHIEGAFYCGIALLFALYGYYRGIGRPEYSIVLTVISLGLRVLLAYCLSPYWGRKAIWWAIVIGWIVADITGLVLLKFIKVKEGESL